MEKRKLGSTGMEISIIGFGAWGIGGYPFWTVDDDAASRKAIQKAADLGVTFFDTAPVYGFGRSERLVGEALGHRRKDVVIATKCGLSWKNENFESIYRDSSAGRIHEEVDASLRRLKTDYIDLYQVHWPDPDTPIEETMGALETLQSSGKIRAIGVSNFSVEKLGKALGRTRVEAVQPKYNMLDRSIEKKLVPFCVDHRIAIVCYSPLDSGVLTGKYDQYKVFKDWRSMWGDFKGKVYQDKIRRVVKLKAIAHDYRMSLTRMAIGWTVAQKGITSAIVGANTEDQVAENVSGGEEVLAPVLLEEIRSVLDAP